MPTSWQSIAVHQSSGVPVCCQFNSLVLSFKQSVADVAADWISSPIQLGDTVFLLQGILRLKLHPLRLEPLEDCVNLVN